MKKVIRAVLLVLSAACIIFNIGPPVASGQVNLGVIIGLAAAAVFAAWAVMFDRVNGTIGKIWKKTTGKIVLSLISLCLIAGLTAGGLTLFRVFSYSRETDKETGYIIVLGCRVNGSRPGIYLRGRIDKAAEYLQSNPSSKAILSGGKGSREDISEARCMYECLTEMGISGDRLIIEDRSSSTYENFRNSIEILNSQGIPIKEITVVTNDFHEYRASEFARMNGIEAYPYPSHTPWTGYLPFAVREVCAIILQVYLKK